MWRALRRGDPRGLEELMSRYTPYVACGGRPGAARPAPGLGGADSGRVPVGLGAPEGAAPEQIRGWLGKVARNRALNRLRASREVLALEEDVLCLAEDGPQRLLEEREQAELVRRALGELERPDGSSSSGTTTTARRWPGRRRRWGSTRPPPRPGSAGAGRS